MKKALCLLFLFATLVPALADNTITLKSGNASVFNSSGEANITFDYSSAEIEGKGTPLEDFLDQKGYKFIAKWERAQEMAHKDFIKRFNKKIPNLKLVTDSKSAIYNFIIQIRTINLGNSARSLVPVGQQTDGGAVLYGRIIVKDKQGSDLCVLKFTNVKGLGTPALESRMLFVYQQLNKDLQKFMKKEASSDSSDDDDNDE